MLKLSPLAIAASVLMASSANAQTPFPQGPASAAPTGTVAVQYNGPPIIHIPGERQGMYPALIDTRKPGELQRFVNENGVQGIQAAVDGTLQECQAIFQLGAMLDDYDRSTDLHAQAQARLERAAPKHAKKQQVLSVAGGVADVGTGLLSGGASGNPAGVAYSIGGVIRGVKQLDNDRWAARLDRHFLSGTSIQIQGTRVFTFSERIYQAAMARHVCPATEDYVARNGRTVSLTPVGVPPPGR